jgi:molecular chaperone GrpE (heat shock protein)
MLIEIFKAGTHTDSAGNTRAWTEKDLDNIASKYNPAHHEAPVVIGHPKDNAPAFGWVEGLERKGSVLYAKLKDLVPEFVEAVKKGLYKKRSISLYPDMTLRHVGFLGAMPPAVKGLADVAFSEAEAVTIEFADYRVNIVGGIFRRLREWLIEKFDTDTADRIVGNWEVEELQREIKEPEVMPAAFNEEGGREMDKIQELETKLSEERKSRSAIEQKFSEKENEAATLRQELEKERAEKRQAEFNSFCEGLMKEGKLTPAMKLAVLDFIEIMSGAGEFEFSEGDGKVKAHPAERFKAFLSGLPKQVEFGEAATKGKAGDHGARVTSHDFSGKVDEERLEIHQKAMEFVEKEGIPYRDALNKALKED